MDRREFAGFLSAVVAASALLPESGAAQQVGATGTMEHPVMGLATPGPVSWRNWCRACIHRVPGMDPRRSGRRIVTWWGCSRLGIFRWKFTRRFKRWEPVSYT